MKKNKNRWLIFAIFFVFMLLHQTDKLLITPLSTQIYNEWNLTDTQWGIISSAALVVGALCYPLWGYLYDRYARSKLLTLAAFIWGSTTWLSAIAPTYSTFLATRASTGIDDSSYPGLYSLIADYFAPKVRGKIYGLLQLTQPLGYLIGLVLAYTIAVKTGWRTIFYITGGLGIILSVIMFFGVKDVPRGSSEAELENVSEMGSFKFEWSKVKDIIQRKSLILMYMQGFFGVFPWNAITYFIFKYLTDERYYLENDIMRTMAPAIIILALGYPLGGMIGDYFFSKSRRGRVLVSLFGVVVGAILLFLTLNIPVEEKLFFGIMLALTALFIPFSSPNVTSTVNDITLPEIRSTALAIQYFIESSGAALSPFITGVLSDTLRAGGSSNPIGTSLLIICTSTWLLCAVVYYLASRVISKDIEDMHTQLENRAKMVKKAVSR